MTTTLRRRTLRRATSTAVAALLACTQAFVPVAHAQDNTPPSIDHEPVREIPAGGSERIEATVTDESSGVAGVTLNFGIGDGGFEEMAMENQGGSLYGGDLPARGASEGDSIRYFITATDIAGNEQSRGFDFDPLVVRVGPAAVQAPAAEESDSKTLWYIAAGGALLLGVIAASAGGGGGGGSAPEQTGLGQRIFVE